ncbi:oxidase cueO precursor [Clohesyomyces aquaticus]|uniref:Oxidase cueO n=1 Tax=Clohesyomyces aquaticus TaxID=1231657 RepID=A0A1Y1ZXN8_9PLEO|nr:oxidase cueO precursor [Clohesyomyces aquaticus]
MQSRLLQSGLAFLWANTALAQGGGFPWLSPVYPLYTQPLAFGDEIQPKYTVTNSDGSPLDYYEVDIKPVQVQIYPNLGKTRLVGYNGQVPGPTFRMRQGREAVVRFVNHGDRANSVHLHGSYSRAPFDGWADDTTEPGQYKDYYYPNRQNARTLWYHDHAVDHTAENAYYGQAGFYILSDAQEDSLGLPSGNYDLPLALAAKRYNTDGSLWDPEANGETVSVFGDVIHVNGVPWPYHKVEPRKYRMRFLNTGISRSYQLYFESSDAVGKQIPFTVFASDAGLTLNPVQTNDLYISVAERWEVLFDFSAYAGKNITLRNNRKVAADDDFNSTDSVMRFMVGDTVTDTNNNLPNGLPQKLRDVPFPPAHAPIEYAFKFERSNGKWERILAKPPRGAVQKWSLANSAGGWSHPIHIHLVDLQIVSRTGGRGALMPYEKVALKDVMWLDVNEQIEVVARYAPWDGVYMFHCHNLIHEDHEMLTAFNVTALADFGYPETTHFIDPMEPRYRAVDFSESDFQGRSGPFSATSIKDKCNFFISLDAYSKVEEVESALVDYWASHTAPGTVGPSASSKAVSATSSKASSSPVPTTFKTSSTKANSGKSTTKSA